MSHLKTLTNGIIKENPVLVTLLGMCPSLAVTTTATNGIGMGLATTFVLVCSNIFISLLKNIIHKEIRLPSYIIIIAGFVTLVKIMLENFFPPLYDALGLFLSLIAVNCIIFCRAEVFASKNSILSSSLDGLGMGLGFTLALFTVGAIRELVGSGGLFGMKILPEVIEPMTIMSLPAGGFFTLAIIIGVVNKLTNRQPKDVACSHCPNRKMCKNETETEGGDK